MSKKVPNPTKMQGGIYLLKYRPWARILLLVLGFLNLIEIPFGTALGI